MSTVELRLVEAGFEHDDTDEVFGDISNLFNTESVKTLANQEYSWVDEELVTYFSMDEISMAALVNSGVVESDRFAELPIEPALGEDVALKAFSLEIGKQAPEKAAWLYVAGRTVTRDMARTRIEKEVLMAPQYLMARWAIEHNKADAIDPNDRKIWEALELDLLLQVGKQWLGTKHVQEQWDMKKRFAKLETGRQAVVDAESMYYLHAGKIYIDVVHGEHDDLSYRSIGETIETQYSEMHMVANCKESDRPCHDAEEMRYRVKKTIDIIQQEDLTRTDRQNY